jgi:glycosyltransferase involved in cell wall biosynthesis
VPAYNSGAYLAAAIDSILMQTYRHTEILVVDGGSIDDTLAVAAKYGPQVRIVSQPTGGPATARNAGVTSAKGELVAFLDADDLWHPEKLTRQMARFEANPELDLCITHIQNFWMPELSDEEERYRDHPRSRPVPGYTTTTLLARRPLFQAVGPFDDQLWFGDAVDWFLRAAEFGAAMEVLPDLLVYHRMHHSNISRRHYEDSRNEFVALLKTHLDRRRARTAAISD